MTFSFESLAENRRSYVDAAKRNGFEEGLRTLLADLYPDNAHFIYELLQNAEDAGAKDVAFELREDGLRVEHDGPKMFDLKDVDSITGIGQSTKATDSTSIGKFGVGFKAVFAYTSSPVIHSGDHSFSIMDLFVPTKVASDATPGRTTFWFPFNREGKSRDQAFAEVAQALRDISHSTLLFLSSITSIASYFPDGEQRLLERRTIDANPRIIAIESAHPDDRPSYWYRAEGDVSIEEVQHRVAVAFSLDQTTDAPSGGVVGSGATALHPSLARFSIRPTDGQVFIHFPAVKEMSGLKFHVHAPFASTVARDSVRDDPGNDELVRGIADLLATVLPQMQSDGLVNDGLFHALPNDRDDLPARYSVIRERVISTFAEVPITPTVSSGTFAESKKLLRSASALRAVMRPDDANVLRSILDPTAAPAVGWIPDRENRSRAFLESLDAIDLGPDEIAQILRQVASDFEIRAGVRAVEADDDTVRALTRAGLWESWISSKDDVWLKSFYVGLGRLAQQPRSNPYPTGDYRRYSWREPFTHSLASAPILRIRKGDGVIHVRGDQAFMPAVAALSTDGLVLDTLVGFGDGESKAKKQDLTALESFYEHTGVKAWDAAAQLDSRLAGYSEKFDFASHLDDLRELIELLDRGAVAVASYANRNLLLTDAVGDDAALMPPTALYLDSPFASTGLSALYESGDSILAERQFPLARAYASNNIDVALLARRLGARAKVQVEPAHAKRNANFSGHWMERENHNAIFRDWTIRFFEEMVATHDRTLLRAIWHAVAETPADRGDAAYRANGSSQFHTFPSQLLQKLTSLPWVLDMYGNLNLPEDVNPEDLDPALRATADAPLLQKIGLGRKSLLAKSKRDEANKTAQALGFESSEHMARVVRIRSKNPEKFDELLARMEYEAPLPEDGSEAPERRAARARGAAASAPRKHYERHNRSVYVQEPGHRSESRGYLRALYTNTNGALVCQICSSEMPFRIVEEYYFEAVQFISDASRDLKENRLALCPTCAAKYRHARATSLADLREDLLTQDIGSRSSLTVAVVLAGIDEQVRFVGKHAVDLQASLAVLDGDMETSTTTSGT